MLAIGWIASETEEKPTVARAVTMEVTKEQAQKILLATNIGKLSLILDQPNVRVGIQIAASASGKSVGQSPSRCGRLCLPARSRRSGTSAAIEPGEGDHRAKWGDGDAQ